MPTLISGAKSEFVRISDSAGVVYEGNTGDEGTKTNLRPIVGPFITVYDIEREGHRIKGILREIEIPVTGDEASEKIFVLGPML